MLTFREFGSQYLESLCRIIGDLDLEGFERFVDAMLSAYDNNRTIFVMGNGGSAATASHFACDINKGCGYGLPKKFRMLCLNDSIPTLLALSNDIGYASVFIEQLKVFLQPGDTVVAFSGSGNSPNVLEAVSYASGQGAFTIGITGYEGGRLAPLVDLALIVPSNDMQKIEDIHVILCHMTMQAIRCRMGAEKSC
ncbi:MAG: SIS domain-containing protein [Thermodesulfobacteriota bacterium]